MRIMTPTLRISLGLTSLCISLILAASFLGFVPDEGESALESRRSFVESLAVQLSWGAARNDVRLMETTLESVVERSDQVISVAMRRAGGDILAQAGDHEAAWVPPPGGRSTATHVQVPVYHGGSRWGSVELVFEPLPASSLATLKRRSLLSLLIFLAAGGLLAFFLFLRRALSELDPSRVIPERVRAAFDALAEGVLVLDEKERVVLANASFADRLGDDPDTLLGRPASGLGWCAERREDAPREFPWQVAIAEGEPQTGVPLRLRGRSGQAHTYMVNATPIMDGNGNSRGALATFDDVTDLEQKNTELRQTLENLERSREKISQQNRELEFLAQRDPMTACLNRRSFLEALQACFTEATRSGEPIACIMGDIDHFKSINDRFGHSVGDEVIVATADILKTQVRDDTLVCRYGGEEFCLVLPGTSMEDALETAERIRRTIVSAVGDRFTRGLTVTMSFGVSTIGDDAATYAELINTADMALYAAKQAGRNRVKAWRGTSTMRALDHKSAKGSAADTAIITQRVAALDDSTAVDRADIGKLVARVRELEARLECYSGASSDGAGYDELTHLPNRASFHDSLERDLADADTNGHSVACLYVDLDLFGRVCDMLGGEVGNNLLRAVAQRLTSVVRGSDSVALFEGRGGAPALSRFSSGEFVIALKGVADAEIVTWVARRVHECLSQPFEVGKHEINVSASVGISVYPEDADCAEELVRYASSARHHAREMSGRGNIVFYSGEMNQRALHQMELESELRHAAPRGELSLEYQPIWDTVTNGVVSMEALLRWDHPRMGRISPVEFIPVAEHTGLIIDVGRWVLRAACQQLAEWHAAGLPELGVSVNLSAVQLRSPELVGMVTETLRDTGVPPHRLELELTETALIKNVDHALNTLRELSQLGVSISIDDFGTGYSSLGHLKKFPVDRIKIDRMFVANVATDSIDAALVAAVIAMSHRMGAHVVAEGVEEEAQLEVLRRMRTDAVQGYLLGRPVPGHEATDRIVKAEIARLEQARQRTGPVATGEEPAAA